MTSQFGAMDRRQTKRAINGWLIGAMLIAFPMVGTAHDLGNSDGLVLWDDWLDARQKLVNSGLNVPKEDPEFQ